MEPPTRDRTSAGWGTSSTCFLPKGDWLLPFASASPEEAMRRSEGDDARSGLFAAQAGAACCSDLCYYNTGNYATIEDRTNG